MMNIHYSSSRAYIIHYGVGDNPVGIMHDSNNSESILQMSSITQPM